MRAKTDASNLFNKSARRKGELTLKTRQFVESSSKKAPHLNSTDNSLQFVAKLYIKRADLLPWSPDRRVSLCTVSSAFSKEEDTSALYVRHDAASR